MKHFLSAVMVFAFVYNAQAQVSTWTTNTFTGQTEVEHTDPYGRSTGTSTINTNTFTGQTEVDHTDPYGRSQRGHQL